MYYVYFIKSLKNKDLYIGSCENVETRIQKHNNGYVRSTKAYRPWKLMGQETFITRGEAVRREKFLKTDQQKELLKTKFKDL